MNIPPFRPVLATEIAAPFHSAVHAIAHSFYGPLQNRRGHRHRRTIMPVNSRRIDKQAYPATIAGAAAGFVEPDPDCSYRPSLHSPGHQRKGIAGALYRRPETPGLKLELPRLFIDRGQNPSEPGKGLSRERQS